MIMKHRNYQNCEFVSCFSGDITHYLTLENKSFPIRDQYLYLFPLCFEYGSFFEKTFYS